jgi:hypothetical protein
MNWRVRQSQPGVWSVTSPLGDRTFDGLPSQAAAIDLARSMAGITIMLAGLQRPNVVPIRRSGYGCHRMPAKVRT